MELLSYNPASDLAWTAAYVVVAVLVLYVGRELTRYLLRDGDTGSKAATPGAVDPTAPSSRRGIRPADRA